MLGFAFLVHVAIIAAWYTRFVPDLRLASRVNQLKPSPTLAITARAMAMRAQGQDVISFAAGEPDFQTPQPIIDAAEKAIKDGYTKYTAGRGLMELREVVAEKFNRENQIPACAKDTIITCGAKHALFDTLMALVNPGDEVIVLAPFWSTYSDQVHVCGGIPVYVDATLENSFIPDLGQIEAAITPRTSLIMACSPNNPSGAVWPREIIQGIAEIAVRHKLWILSDEVYEKLVYEGEHVSFASLGQEVYDQTITVGSCSKTFSMTGWRIGYLSGPSRAVDAIANVQDTISHPTSFAMKAAVTAFSMLDEDTRWMKEAFEKRRDLMYRLVCEIPGVKAYLPPGAFYIFADFSAHLGEKGANDMELAETLLVKAGVAVIPGAVFHSPGFLRLSYAASEEDISRGMTRIADALRT